MTHYATSRVCANCKRDLYVVKNEVLVADLWGCRTCDTRVIAGFGQRALAEHWEEHFPKWQEYAASGEYQVMEVYG